MMRIMAALALFSSLLSAGENQTFINGTPEIRSISVLHFNTEGILFVGDSKGGSVFAIQLNEKKAAAPENAPQLKDIEKTIAALTGAKSEDILIHDMAVSPLSHDVYLAVSRGRAKWVREWQLPNNVDDARLLFRTKLDGTIEEVPLQNILFAQAKIPNPVNDTSALSWQRDVKLRTDAITCIQFDNDKVYISGLSNENFQAAMWIIPYPFTKDISATTLEIYHGAHGQYETDSPIRSFIVYNLKDGPHILASYLCTPLVTFPVSNLENGKHIRGKTVAEFGSNNFPIDMVTSTNNGKEFIVMANSNLPLIVFDPKDINNVKEGITKEVEGYAAGLAHTKRSGIGIQHLGDFNDKSLLALKRMPSGSLDLISLRKERMVP